MLRTKLLHASGQIEKKFISNFAYLCGFILHIFKQLFSLKLANYKISKKFGKNYKRKCCMFQGKQKHNKNTAFIVLYCIKGIYLNCLCRKINKISVKFNELNKGEHAKMFLHTLKQNKKIKNQILKIV